MLAASIAVGSCADHTFDDFGSKPGSYSNLIRFDVSSGFEESEQSSRANDSDDEGLCPLVLSEGSDTLYLHRYVAPESWRATGRLANVQSRAAQINDAADFTTLCGEDGFMVCAINESDDSQFFPLTVAKPLTSDSEENIWYIPNPEYRFWPEGEKELRFNAYAPKTAGSSLENLNLTGKTITFDYTVPTYTDADGKRRDAEKQPDLMFASSVCTHDKNGDGHTDYAPLNFRHALSAIKFAIRDVSKWTISDISLVGVSGAGSCTFTPDATVTEPLFEWTVGEPEATFTQTFNYEMVDPYEPGSDDPDHEVPSVGNAPVLNDKMPEKTFMLIPQNISEDAELQIKLTFEDKTKILKGRLKTSDITSWEPGKEYVYTISTTPINWTYVFKVTGSIQGEKHYDKKKHKWVNGDFSDANDRIEIGAAVTEGSYYEVESYRYRTNNPTKIELLPWKAVATDGVNTVPDKFSEYKSKIPTSIQSADWLLDNWVFEHEGSSHPERFGNLSFALQYIATDYKGDWDMRAKGEKYGYTNNQIDPVDLSMVYGKRNTANCYVVNAGGWYSIPLYYGSAIKNDDDISDTYKNIDYSVESTYPSLPEFLDYKGNPIGQAQITTPVKDAILVWQDAAGIINECKYDETNRQIVFHVDPTYLQQANCVLAIRDAAEDIIWSWHIWVTDHWVNEENLQLGVGNVECEADNPNKGPFDLAPYNLGWCDPKNVLYLKRSGTMTFTQTESDKTSVLATKTLQVIQRAEDIEYWIGNSTYYQFGRKDPMVGFINDKNEEKHNFGKMPYEVINTGDIKDWILYPNAFFEADNQRIEYYNLWNNYNSDKVTIDGKMTLIIPNSMITPEILKKFETGEKSADNLSFSDYTKDGEAKIESGNPNLNPDFAYSAKKTIYDPSPAGYVVPPCDFFQIFGVGNPNSGALISIENPAFFKGDSIPISGHPGYFNYTASPKRDHTGDKKVIFNVNGQKRNSSWNMNPCVLYLWSNTAGFYRDWNPSGLGLGFCLGFDTNKEFCLDTYFQASRLIARPVRCIKEP